MSSHYPTLVPGTMAEANIAGTYYVCNIAGGPDGAQMFTVRFANGAEQQVHASLLRTTPPSAAPVAVATQPAAVAVVTATYPTQPMPANGKAPLAETPVASASYPTPAVTAPAAVASYPVNTATGIYPAVPTAAVAPNPVFFAGPAPAVVVLPAPVIIVAPAAAGPRFAVNEDVEARFRGSWFASKIVKSLGKGKYKVKFLKSKTFSTLSGNAIRKKKGAAVRQTTTTTTTMINQDLKKRQTTDKYNVGKDIDSGFKSVGNDIDTFLFGKKKKKTKKKPKQKFKVTTTTTTKIVNGRKIVTKTTKKTAIPAPTTGQRLSVVVPAGCFPGQVIAITTSDGKRANVAIPAGVSAGQSFQVILA